MSASASDLLALIRPDRDANLGVLAKHLGVDERAARDLGDDLVELGVCAWASDRKKRLRRVDSVSTSSGQTEASEPAALDGVSELAQALWRALPLDGEMVTNVEVRSRDEFSEADGADLQEARRELKRAGLVELRAGRDGGGLRRRDVTRLDAADPVTEPNSAGDIDRAGDRLEEALYAPFRDWLVQELDADAFVFAEATVTARARRKGKWAQPDVCQLTVTNFDHLPTATVELSSYELKRRADSGKLEAVYEAAAHGRWAHRANLVLEVENRDSKVAPEILKDAARFGLGVYKLWFSEADRVSVQRLMASQVQNPEDSDLDDMISVVLEQLGNQHRKRYRQAVK